MRQAMMMTIVLVILGWFWLFPRPDDILYIHQNEQPLKMIKVEIIGAVEFPGVYHFFEDVTVSQALFYAGDIYDDADLSMLNMSEIIYADRQLIVKSNTHGVEESHQLVNVNKASFKELIQIPGMTEIRAASLIIYREQYGHFKHLDELIHVKNIGSVTLEKIKPYITLG